MKQYRIGILGTENSHALHFASAFNKQCEENPRYKGFRVTALFGHYPEENKKMSEEYGIDFIADKPEDMIGKVDAVIVCARDGKFHYEFAKPFIDAGLPLFLDKPTTIEMSETFELLSLAKKNNIPVCGGSVLKYAPMVNKCRDFVNEKRDTVSGGFVAAPLFLDSPYSGFYFYAAHLVEICLPVFGWNPLSVIAIKNEKGVDVSVDYGTFSVVCKYNDFCPDYACGVFEKETSILEKIDLENSQDAECDDFVQMVESGKMPYSYEEIAMPIVVMNAIEESYKTGKRVFVDKVEV